MSMTREEQIKKVADEYADKLYKDGRCTESTAPTIQEIYIAGAHSRDEEIRQLRNPWISVEERLPAKYELVLVKTGRGNFYLAEKDSVAQPRDEFVIPQLSSYVNGVTHWMPIPELKKEE